MSLNFRKSGPQVALQSELDPLELHLVNVDVEAVVSILRLLTVLLNLLLLLVDHPQNHRHQIELERQEFWRHFLVVQQLSQLGNLLIQ